MNKEDIIRTAEKIARQCTRRTPPTWTHEFAVSYIMSMVELAVEDEREACANLCKELAPSTKTMTAYKVLHEASKAIQSRGQE